MFCDVVSNDARIWGDPSASPFITHPNSLSRISNTISEKYFIAHVNGASASFSYLTRSVGHIVTGKIFTKGLDLGYVGIAFWTLTGVAFLGSLESFILTDHP